MMLPAVEQMRTLHPSAHVTLLIRENLVSLFQKLPLFDEVIGIQKRRDFFGFRRVYETAKILRKKNFDRGFLFTNSFSTAMEMFLGNVKQRYGFDRYARKRFLTHPIKYDPKKWKTSHHVETYQYIVDQDNTREGKMPLFSLPKGVDFGGTQIPLQWLAENDLLVGFCPGAHYGPAKQWPLEYFQELKKSLIKEHRAKILIFGTEGEKNLADGLSKDDPEHTITLAGKTDTGQLAGLIQRCRVMICNDSGVAHLSAALGVPTVVIFGSTDPKKTRPLGEHVSVFYESVRCSPCFRRTCPLSHDRYQCLLKIRPEHVLARLKDIFKENAA